MKTGRSLTELAAELERQLDTRKDYRAPQSAIKMEIAADNSADSDTIRAVPIIRGINGGPLGVTEYAHGQFASHLNIPKVYYDRMRVQEPELLASNVNAWLEHDGNQKRLIRTLDGRVRAFLSAKYRTLDCYDLLKISLPALKEARAQVISSEITETRFYLKAIFPDLCANVPEGTSLGEGHARIDSVIASVIISNSEVGAGSLRVEAGCFKTKCTNLAIFDGSAMRKYHIGRSSVAELDAAVECFSDETKKADDAAFWMKVRDVVASSCNKEAFTAQVEKMKAAAFDRIESPDLPKVVEVTRKRLGLGDGLQNDLLKRLIEGQDLTRWGLLNAVTRTAEDQKDYDVATDLERAGGKILELPKTEWQTIATAA